MLSVHEVSIGCVLDGNEMEPTLSMQNHQLEMTCDAMHEAMLRMLIIPSHHLIRFQQLHRALALVTSAAMRLLLVLPLLVAGPVRMSWGLWLSDFHLLGLVQWDSPWDHWHAIYWLYRRIARGFAC